MRMAITDFSPLVHELMVRDLTVTAFMRELVTAHVQAHPDVDWAPLERIDFDEEATLLERWLVPCFKREPPKSKRVKALVFGLLHPVRNDETVTDMYVAGTMRVEMDQVPCEWNVSPAYRPMRQYANSRVLRDIHRAVASVENFLCVGYAAKTMATLLPRVDPRELILGKRTEVQITVAWDSGEPLYIGHLDATGFVPLPLERALAGLQERAKRWEEHNARPKPEPTIRNLHHPDGRRWSITVTDESIELRFTDTDGDEHSRVRHRARDEKMTTVAESLVQEQIQDGFVEQ
jgi:hypothetical protein